MQDRPTQETPWGKEVVLTAYFSGSGHDLDSSTLAGFLFNNNDESLTQTANGFPGCGITNGLMGTLFGAGLKQQCQVIKKQVLDLIKNGSW